MAAPVTRNSNHNANTHSRQGVSDANQFLQLLA